MKMTGLGKTDENRAAFPSPPLKCCSTNDGNTGHIGILIRKYFVTIQLENAVLVLR